ncbi:MAG: polyketide synthase, partial [Gemmatimonadetes bacterium]|nr:polyketide synthase [Gemmatimonadota bacterium]
MMSGNRAIAIVGIGAVLPDAPDAATFWQNLMAGRSSITEVPPERWDAALYYDPDPRAPDRTYSKIGGWVKQCEWNPLAWKLPIPPRVAEHLDATQKWAIVATREALADYGYPQRPLDAERTAVIFGNAMGGDNHLHTANRIHFPEIAQQLASGGTFAQLPADVRTAVLEELQAGVRQRIPDITEDTMPGELSNVTAGRIAALYDFKGPNFVTDAACASAMAAIAAAVHGLETGTFDAVLTGGIDANMSPSSYVKFCKIGALSATGSRPYAEGADGFVMAEGGAVFVLKRLADAEAAGDRIYAVLRGIGASSDGRGKGITAPNPVGQRLAVQRAWDNAGLAPEAGDLVEGHGTSTRVGDLVEVNSLIEVLGRHDLPTGSIALGSVKSNFGHLKAAAGAAGVLKAVLALHHQVLPPTINFAAPNPGIDFARSALRVQTGLADWPKKQGSAESVRRAGVSSFGFGGTNFHIVLEEYVPGRLRDLGSTLAGQVRAASGAPATSPAGPRAPLRGALVVGAENERVLSARLRAGQARAAHGSAPEHLAPLARDLGASLRVAIDYGDAAELAELSEKAAAA